MGRLVLPVTVVGVSFFIANGVRNMFSMKTETKDYEKSNSTYLVARDADSAGCTAGSRAGPLPEGFRSAQRCRSAESGNGGSYTAFHGAVGRPYHPECGRKPRGGRQQCL